MNDCYKNIYDLFYQWIHEVGLNGSLDIFIRIAYFLAHNGFSTIRVQK